MFVKGIVFSSVFHCVSVLKSAAVSRISGLSPIFCLHAAIHHLVTKLALSRIHCPSPMVTQSSFAIPCCAEKAIALRARFSSAKVRGCDLSLQGDATSLDHFHFQTQPGRLFLHHGSHPFCQLRVRCEGNSQDGVRRSEPGHLAHHFLLPSPLLLPGSWAIEWFFATHTGCKLCFVALDSRLNHPSPKIGWVARDHTTNTPQK